MATSEGISKTDRSQATRAALTATARELFAARGYAAVGTEEIVRTAGVTRGALYHHFDGKLELFAAVYEQVEAELVQRIAEAVDDAGEPRRSTSCAPASPPSSTPARATRRCSGSRSSTRRRCSAGSAGARSAMRYGLGLVQGTIEAAIEAGEVEPQPAGPLAHLLLGAIDEGAMLIARAPDGGETRRQVGDALGRMLDALTSR